MFVTFDVKNRAICLQESLPFNFEVINRAMFVEKPFHFDVNNRAVCVGNAFDFYVSNCANCERKTLSF